MLDPNLLPRYISSRIAVQTLCSLVAASDTEGDMRHPPPQPSFLVLKTDMENVIGIRYKKKYLCKKLGGNRVTYGRERISCLVHVRGLGVHFGRFDRVSHY